MYRRALGKHGWSYVLGLLLCVTTGSLAHAAPERKPLVAVAIASPTPDTVVAGRISISVAYNKVISSARISAFTLLVDDQIHSSEAFADSGNSGTEFIELDTRSIPDGNHVIKVMVMGSRGALGLDSVRITVRNGVAGGPDRVPPLVSFRRIREGQTIKGPIDFDVLAEDNVGIEFLTVFVNRRPVWLTNQRPFTFTLDPSKFLEGPADSLLLEAKALDRTNNEGIAKPIRIKVVPPDGDLTPMKPDPTISSGSLVPETPVRPTADPMSTPMMPERGPVVIKGPGSETIATPGNGVTVDLPGAGSAPSPGRATPPNAGSRRTGPTQLANGNTRPQDPEISGPRAPKPAAPAKPATGFAQMALNGTAFPDTIRGGAGRTSLGDPRGSAPQVTDPEIAPGANVRIQPVKPRVIEKQPTTAVKPVTGPAEPVRNAVAKPEQPTIGVDIQGGGKVESARGASATAEPGDSPMRYLPNRAAASTPLTNPLAGLRQPAAEKPVTVKPAVKPEAPKMMANASIGIRRSPEIAPARVTAPVTAPVARISETTMTVGTLAAPTLRPRGAASQQRDLLPGGGRALAMSKPVPTQMVKVTTPVVGSRTKPAAPAVIVFDRNAKPNKEGRIPVTVLSVNRKALPRDRFHTLKAGETLTNVAKQYRVTPKSLLVANAVTNPSALHVGSRIRVPGTFDVVLDNQKIDFDVQPRLENGIPLAPFRQIFEHAGGVVVWNNENQAIRAANDRTDVRLQIGSKQASVNQTVVVMDREAFLDSGRTIVPLGFLEKALDMKAEYDPKTGAILFSRK